MGRRRLEGVLGITLELQLLSRRAAQYEQKNQNHTEMYTA